MQISVTKQNLETVSEETLARCRALRAGQSRFASPFFSIDLASSVSKVRSDVALLMGTDADGLAFYWPMHLSRSGVARGLGGPFSDRNGPVTRAGLELNIEALLTEQKIRSFRTDGLVFEPLSPNDNLEIAYTNETHLTEDTEIFFKAQQAEHASHFKRLRRLGRKLEKEHTEVEFRFDDKRPETFAALIALKREQYAETNRHDVLGSTWARDMFAALWAGKVPGQHLRLSTLHIDGKLAAAELNLHEGETLHGWIVAYDPEFSKYSPGNLVTQFVIQNMLENGIRFYDSGIDGDHYKKYFTNARTPLGVGTIRTATNNLAPGKLLAKAWTATERASPGKLASLMGRTRRRSDQILASETRTAARLKGYLNALRIKV